MPEKCAHDLLNGRHLLRVAVILRGIARRSRVQIGGPLLDYSETAWIPMEFMTSGRPAG